MGTSSVRRRRRRQADLPEPSIYLSIYQLAYTKQGMDKLRVGGYSCVLELQNLPNLMQEIYKGYVFKKKPNTKQLLIQTRSNEGEIMSYFGKWWLWFISHKTWRNPHLYCWKITRIFLSHLLYVRPIEVLAPQASSQLLVTRPSKENCQTFPKSRIYSWIILHETPGGFNLLLWQHLSMLAN